MKKFWNYIRNEEGERILRLEGPIDEDSLWGDCVTPSAFREELEAEEGDLTVWVNSPGGNVFAAAEIYTMLCDHKGKVTVKIDAIAASAASVVAMAGDTVLMSPVSMLMIHDPMTIAMGNAADMEKAISTLNEVKESIINAYARKTGLSRKKIAQLMSDETWLNAKKAVELGFADGILFSGQDREGANEDEQEVQASLETWQPYSTRIMGQTILNRLSVADEPDAPAADAVEEPTADPPDVEPSSGGMSGSPLMQRDDSSDTPVGESPEPVCPEQPLKPVIGMDGKTEDGAMPYELLKRQLEYLR